MPCTANFSLTVLSSLINNNWWCHAQLTSAQVQCQYAELSLLIQKYTMSQKNEPTLTSCSFVKHGLILIILCKQHRHTFKNSMHIHLSLSLYFCLLYLLLNSCDRNYAKQCVFLGRLLVALERAGFILADVLSDVLSPSSAFFH